MEGMNYVLAKSFLATGGNVAYNRGDLVVAAAGSTLQPTQVALSSASTDRIVGVVLEDLDAAKVNTGKAYVSVLIMGVAQCVAGAALATIGTRVMPGASGTAKQAIAAATTGNVPFGVTMGVSGAQGDYISVLLTPGLPALP
jgi:hypothetical protein